MTDVKVLSGDELKEHVKTNKTVLVDFWADWCGPCKMIAPILDEIASENPNVSVVKVNVDENRETAVEFGVRSIPTLILFESSEPIDTKVGAATKGELSDFIKKS